MFLENELMYGVSFDIPAEVNSEEFLLPLNKAKVMRQGKDVTVAAHSIGVQFAVQVRGHIVIIRQDDLTIFVMFLGR